MTVLVVLEGLVIGLLLVLVAGLLRSHADILRALHDLGAGDHQVAPGSPVRRAPTTEPPLVRDDVVPPGPGVAGAPEIVGLLPAGGQRVVAPAGAPHPTLLAFLSTGCATCAEFWGAFADAAALELPGADTRVVIVTKGPEAESPAAVADLAPGGITTVMSNEAWVQYAVPGSPYFVLVDGPTGRVVGEGSGTSWEQVAGLLRSAVADAGWTADARRARQAREDGRYREERADEELLAAGIRPGDESLYPASVPQVEPTEEGRA